MTVDYQAVAKAADEMLAADPNARITVRSIAAKLNKSNRDVNDAVAEWKERQAESKKLEEIELPPEVLKLGIENLKRMFTEANRLAQAGHKHLQEALIAAEKELEATEADAEKQMMELEEKLDAANLAIKKMESEAALHAKTANNQRTEIARMTERLAAAEKANAKLETRADKLQEQLLSLATGTAAAATATKSK